MANRGFTSNVRIIAALSLTAARIFAQAPPPPPPPRPPQFMTMKGLDLSCFEKPRFEENGLEFFLCNGGGGLAGVRRKSDPAHIILVHDPDIAKNLDMQSARMSCPRGRFAVHADAVGIFWFTCDNREIKTEEKFTVAAKADWAKYSAYLYR
jgi:hypothetical protein